MSYYMICARDIKNGKFIAEPGKLRYLKVPDDANEGLVQHEIDVRDWMEEVRDLADGMGDKRMGKGGDVLIFVHGYNNTPQIIKERQSLLASTLEKEGFNGVVCSFDWPSDDSTLNYYEDRTDAANTASFLVSGGITALAMGQEADCQTNVHLLGHSTGAYVIQQAFCRSKMIGPLYQKDWRVAQIALIGGDISTFALAVDDQESAEMFKRCMRITNYSNGFDYVLAVSNAKRLGVSPRVGRVGIPKDASPKAVDVDCSAYFKDLDPNKYAYRGTFAHAWHIGNPVFARDLALSLTGGMDRNVMPTRIRANDGRLLLGDGERPTHWDKWDDTSNG